MHLFFEFVLFTSVSKPEIFADSWLFTATCLKIYIEIASVTRAWTMPVWITISTSCGRVASLGSIDIIHTPAAPHHASLCLISSSRLAWSILLSQTLEICAVWFIFSKIIFQFISYFATTPPCATPRILLLPNDDKITRQICPDYVEIYRIYI